MTVAVQNEMPTAFYDVDIRDIRSVFPEPTLVHLEGGRKPNLFISVLLHGNEISGFLAVQNLLKKYHSKNIKLPRSLSIFFGNVRAAEKGVRKLSGQLDFNRIWVDGDHPENEMAEEILVAMKKSGMFACIDIHNNSGRNPYYACFNKMEPAYLYLASLFSKTTVFFTKPPSVLSLAFAKYCPSLTLECGLPGEARGVERLEAFLDDCLHLDHIPTLANQKLDIQIFNSKARIILPHDSTIGIGEQTKDCDFGFIDEIDLLNFCEVKKNTLLGWRWNQEKIIKILNDQDEDIFDQYLKYEGNEIHVRSTLIPSMFTRDLQIIRDDCLGYIMEPLPV